MVLAFATRLDVISQYGTFAGSSVGPLQLHAGDGLGNAQVAGRHRRAVLRPGRDVPGYRRSEVDRLRAYHEGVRHLLLQRLDQQARLRYLLLNLLAETLDRTVSHQ